MICKWHESIITQKLSKNFTRLHVPQFTIRLRNACEKNKKISHRLRLHIAVSSRVGVVCVVDLWWAICGISAENDAIRTLERTVKSQHSHMHRLSKWPSQGLRHSATTGWTRTIWSRLFSCNAYIHNGKRQSMEWTGSIRWIHNPVQSIRIWMGLDQKFTNSADSGLDWIQKCTMCITYLETWGSSCVS